MISTPKTLHATCGAEIGILKVCICLPTDINSAHIVAACTYITHYSHDSVLPTVALSELY
jgi:hypothetical protein